MPTWKTTGRFGPLGGFTRNYDAALAVSTMREATPVGDIIISLLEQFSEPLYMVFDPNSGTLLSSDSASDRAQFEMMVNALSPAASLTLAPDAGASGKSLPWSVVADVNWPLRYAVNPIIDAVKPKRSVNALSNSLLAAHLNHPLVMLLDQSAGTVKLFYLAPENLDAVKTGLRSLNSASVNAVGLQMFQGPRMWELEEWGAPTPAPLEMDFLGLGEFVDTALVINEADTLRIER